ncbi:MAG: hypothetical protein DMG13_22905 [Acidobacteria bacterium]|nr:MAG: hypothetical protein DMG13_22905 [Acidobacteriota bacterium]
MMSWAWVTKQVLMMSAKLMHAIRGFTVFPDKYSNYQQPIARISVAAVDFYRLRAIALALRVLEAARYRACASRFRGCALSRLRFADRGYPESRIP